MTDEELVNGCVAQDKITQQLLFDRFKRKMMGVCLRYSDRREEAEDIFQNGFVRVFENIKTFKGLGSLEGWVRRIMVNEALTYIRKNKAMKLNVDIDKVEYMLPGGNLISESMNAKDLLNIIQKLPIGFRTVFNLYAIEGYSHKEIAMQLGISEGTSQSQYARARVHLQKMVLTEKTAWSQTIT